MITPGINTPAAHKGETIMIFLSRGSNLSKSSVYLIESKLSRRSESLQLIDKHRTTLSEHMQLHRLTTTLNTNKLTQRPSAITKLAPPDLF
jgi:D-arabinose 5-phosphate isomerase GutQ